MNQLIIRSECVIFNCGIFLFMPNFVSLPVYTHAASLEVKEAENANSFSVLRRWQTWRNRFDPLRESSFFRPLSSQCSLGGKEGEMTTPRGTGKCGSWGEDTRWRAGARRASSSPRRSCCSERECSAWWEKRCATSDWFRHRCWWSAVKREMNAHLDVANAVGIAAV